MELAAAVPDRRDYSYTTKDPRTRLCEVLANELCTAGSPAQLWRPSKVQRTSPPAGTPPGNRESSPGHVSLTTSALGRRIFSPARSFFLDPRADCGPAEGFLGRRLRSRPGYEDAGTFSGKKSSPTRPSVPGKVWSRDLEQFLPQAPSSCPEQGTRAEALPTSSGRPEVFACCASRTRHELLRARPERFMVPNPGRGEALGVAVLGQRGHSPYRGHSLDFISLLQVMNGLPPKNKYVNKIFPRGCIGGLPGRIITVRSEV